MVRRARVGQTKEEVLKYCRVAPIRIKIAVRRTTAVWGTMLKVSPLDTVGHLMLDAHRYAGMFQSYVELFRCISGTEPFWGLEDWRTIFQAGDTAIEFSLFNPRVLRVAFWFFFFCPQLLLAESGRSFVKPDGTLCLKVSEQETVACASVVVVFFRQWSRVRWCSSGGCQVGRMLVLSVTVLFCWCCSTTYACGVRDGSVQLRGTDSSHRSDAPSADAKRARHQNFVPRRVQHLRRPQPVERSGGGKGTKAGLQRRSATEGPWSRAGHRSSRRGRVWSVTEVTMPGEVLAPLSGHI